MPQFFVYLDLCTYHRDRGQMGKHMRYGPRGKKTDFVASKQQRHRPAAQSDQCLFCSLSRRYYS